jgi:hypothetical protein
MNIKLKAKEKCHTAAMLLFYIKKNNTKKGNMFFEHLLPHILSELCTNPLKTEFLHNFI